MTLVYKFSDNVKKEIIKYYKDKVREKTPPHAVFQAKDNDTVITLYESGKIMFQGVSADVDANVWKALEMKLNNKDISKEEKEKENKEIEENKEENIDYTLLSTIGSDEVGTGDYFGPIVVTASYVSKDNIEFLNSLNVRDSKNITDSYIKNIAPKIMEKIPHVTTILSNELYNKPNVNLKQVLAISHNLAIYNLLNKGKYSYAKIIVDKFCSKENYYNYLEGQKNIVKYATFITKAENKVLSVAVSSIISRYIFLREINKLSDSLHIPLKKGADKDVEKIGKEIVEKYGEDKLKYVAKLNFKNTKRILDIEDKTKK